MLGMDRTTGRAVEGFGHLRQSVTDILTTSIGSRPMRRDYGSRLMQLLDRPLNTETRMELSAAAIEALDRWEPRLRVRQVTIEGVPAEGQVTLAVRGEYIPEGREVALDGIVL